MKRTHAHLLGVSLAAVAAGSVQAQTTALEEVIVTAQKREQNLQEVPISITALTGEALVEGGVRSLQDLTQLAPGLTIGTTGGNSATFTYIRGGGTNLIDISADPSVATFIDEVYVPGTSGMQFDLLDIERVEVLKGPQGTLFGRNAAAGAISIVTRRPDEELGGSVSVDSGNYGLMVGRGSVTGPLTEDGAWQYRLTAMRRHRDPVTDNLAGADPGEIDSYGARGQLQYERGDVDALLTLGYYDADNGPADVFTFTSGFVGALIDNPAPLAAHPNDFFRVWRNRPDGFEKQQISDASLRLEWSTGIGLITSITAYRDTDYHGTDDRDGTFADAMTSDFIERHATLSQELRISDDSDRWHWIAGLYYYHDDGYNNQTYITRADMALYPDSGGVPISDQHWLTVDSYAAFGQVTYDLTDKLSLTAGGRYTIDEKESDRDIDVDALLPFFLYPQGSYTAQVADDWSSFNPVVTLQYQASPDLMMYGSVRSGYKSGGFQTLLPSTRSLAQTPYEPENVLSSELGVRSEWLDGRLLLNLSVFHVETTDQQVSLFDSGQLKVLNASESTTDGVDLQLRAHLTDRLTIDWSATGQSARFGDYRYFSPIEGPVDNTDNHQLRSPDLSTSAGADYAIALGTAGTLTLHADYFYQSVIYFNDANYHAQAGTFQPSYDLYNARVTYRSPEQTWELALWGRNLGDEHYCSNIIVWATPAPGTGTCSPGDPRTYGLSIRYQF